MPVRTPPEGLVTMKIWQTGIFLLLFFILILNDPAHSQVRRRLEEWPAPIAPYGITYDGTNFWYSDGQSRKIVRIPPSGRPDTFFIGNRKIFGISFNGTDGHIYAGSEGHLLRINPVAGGVEEGVSIPLPEIAGAAFGPGIWYVLEKGTGKIHLFDPSLGRILSSFDTGHTDARDIALYRGYLWVSDGESGIIFRFRASDGRRSGSLRGSVKNLRGLCFAEGQLWVVNRDEKKIQRMPYTETDRFIAGGEKRYMVHVSMTFQVPATMNGRVLILQPPNSEAQKARSVRALTAGWNDRTFTSSGERAFSREFGEKDNRNVSFEYECLILVQNVRYFVPEDYVFAPESIETSAARYFIEDEDDLNAPSPPASIRQIKNIANERFSQDLWNEARQKNIPIRWTAAFTPGEAKELSPPVSEIYVRSFGWVPLPPEPGDREIRNFARNLDRVELYRMPDEKASGISPVFFTTDQGFEIRNLQAIQTLTFKSVIEERP